MLIIKIILILVFLILDFILIKSILKGAPYAPTTPAVVASMLQLANVQPSEKAVDLGSGDGRLVIALAKAGAQADGYENNPLLVWLSRYKIMRAGLQNKAHIYYRSYWPEDLGQYSLITLFGMTHIMPALSEKLNKELTKGTRIICNSYSLKDWQPVKIEKRLFLYIR
jgi:protein-L-isoaspartate O-methyltransferase